MTSQNSNSLFASDYMLEAQKATRLTGQIDYRNAVTEETSPKRGRPRAERPLVAFSISLPEELRRQIEADAEREGRSVAGQIRQILQRHYKP